MPLEHRMSVRDPDHIFLLSALERFEQPLIRYARGIVGGIEAARDIVQDVFLKLHETIEKVDRERITAWLFTVCRNRALDHQRKHSRIVNMELEVLDQEASPHPAPSQEMESRELNRDLKRWIAALPEKQREAVRLKFEAGLSYKEISETLKTSTGNVGSLISLGIATLRERWLAMNA